MTHLIATFFYIGHLRPAPGTLGSLAALPGAWALYMVGGHWALAIGALTAFALGLWATGIETAGADDHDPSHIVIDEVAGQWIALWPIAYGAAFANVDVLALYPGWIGAFLFFRLFDIWKPGPVGRADRRGDALGVMLDDVIAGVFAALAVSVLAVLAHFVLV